MSNLEQKTVEILDKLDAAISHYSPQVYDAAVASVQVSAAGELALGFLLLIPSVFFVKFARKANVFMNKKIDENWLSNWDMVQIIAGIIWAVIYFVMVAAAMCSIFDVWNWVAIFNPKLALAHKIMGL